MCIHIIYSFCLSLLQSRKRMTISRDFRFSAPNYAKVEQVKEYLQKKEKYNALALLLRYVPLLFFHSAFSCNDAVYIDYLCVVLL